jgi:hypothetical protein
MLISDMLTKNMRRIIFVFTKPDLYDTDFF